MYKCDGHVREIGLDDIEPGVVVRMIEREIGFKDGEVIAPFSDFVVLGFKSGDRVSAVISVREFNSLSQDLAQRNPASRVTYVLLARPYVCVSNAGTTSPTPLLGCENIDVEYTRMIGPESLFRLVVQASGKTFKYTT